MLEIITRLEEYSQADLKQLELMILIATRKGYLYEREKDWFLNAIMQGESIGVKYNGLLIANAMLSSFFHSNTVMYGAVWRNKYKGGDLIFSQTLRIAKNKFNCIYAKVRKSNLDSFNLCQRHGAYLIKNLESVDKFILDYLNFDKEKAWLFVFNK